MICYDLYEIKAPSIEIAKGIVEKLLSIKMQEQESSHLNDYYRLYLGEGKEISVSENVNDWDGEDYVLEPNFPAMELMIQMNGFSYTDAENYKTLLLTCQQITFLRRITHQKT